MANKGRSTGTSKKIRREQARRAETPWRQKAPVDAKMEKLLKELSPEERLRLREGLEQKDTEK
jgi:uncharacterized membrane protein